MSEVKPYTQAISLYKSEPIKIRAQLKQRPTLQMLSNFNYNPS